MTRVIPDRLHLFLRISDQLINQLIKDLKTEDNITKMTKFSDDKRHTYKHIQGFEEYLKEIGINWHFFMDKDTFSGPEKLKILKHMKISLLLPQISKVKTDKMQRSWDNFTLLVKELDELKFGDNTQIQQFNANAKQWVTDYITIYPTKDVTPYMHLMAYHVSEVIEMHGALSQFTEQGLEKLNDNVSKWYFRSTGFNQGIALKQLIQKQNRIRKLEFDGGKRKPKFQWKCRKCASSEHKTKQCPAP